MTQLSRSALLGLAKETVLGTYVTPAVYIPFLGSSGFEDMFASIKDESYRNNDSMVQGIYQGPVHTEWTIDVMAYPDLVGHFLRAMIGPDTTSAGASTTTSGSSIVGATTLSVTSATGITAGTYISIDTTVNQEYALVTAVVSTTLTVTGAFGAGLTKAHASSSPVTTPTTHTFKQTTANKPTYSLTLYDTTQTLSCVAAACTDVGIKIDPKGAVQLNTKWMSYPSTVATPVAATYTTIPPALGWEWLMTNGGASSTRGLSFDVALKRSAEPIASSDGTQGPREIFVGPIECSGTMKAIFENQTDINLYNQNNQLPTTAMLQQPVGAGGESLALTMNVSAYTKGKRDLGPIYTQADFSIEGVFNTTDTGSISAVLKNWLSAAY